MVELKTHKLWCQYNGCTHCVNSNDSSRENYSSHQTLYVLTGWHGSSCWLLCLFVLYLFCVLCCLQNNPVFSSVTYLICQKMKIMSYVFWRVSSLRREKKVLVVCLAGARSLLRPEKKVLVVCLAGARLLLRPEKKSSSHLSGRCAIVITTGKKSSSHLSGRCAIVITTGKKSSSRLSGGLCCCVSFWFWREIGSYFVVAGKFYYDRKKKL